MGIDYFSALAFFNGASWDRYLPFRADEREIYDVIVVGSGMGGGILADATSDMGMRTLVLEAGPIRHLVNITDLPLPNVVESFDPYELSPGTRLTGGVSFNLGGRSVYWSAVIPRMRDWELRYWPDDVAQHLREKGYERAERLFRKRTGHPEFQQNLVANFQTAFPDLEVTHLPRSYHQPDSGPNVRDGSPDERSSGVFSTAALLAKSLTSPGAAGSGNLDVAVEHVVTSVLHETNAVSAVEAIDLRNRRRRIFRGKVVVLAGGTTETARLALSSRIPDASGLVGVGLSDHPEAEFHFEVPPRSPLVTAEDQGNVFLRPPDKDPLEDKFSCELALNHKFWDVRVDDDDLWRQRFERSDDRSVRSTIKFLFRQPLNPDRSRLVG